MIPLTEDRKVLGYGSLGSYSNISHFVTTRRGGCSKDAYATFNCSPFSGDEMENVRRNQELLFEATSVKPSELIIPHQTHGVRNLVIDRTFLSLPEGERCGRLEGIDALMTDVAVSVFPQPIAFLYCCTISSIRPLPRCMPDGGVR